MGGPWDTANLSLKGNRMYRSTELLGAIDALGAELRDRALQIEEIARSMERVGLGAAAELAEIAEAIRSVPSGYQGAVIAHLDELHAESQGEVVDTLKMVLGMEPGQVVEVLDATDIPEDPTG